MYTVSYRGADGPLWELAGDRGGSQGVILGNITGLVGSASASTTTAPGRVGVVRTGVPVVPVMSGTLQVVISGADASPRRPTPGVLRQWRRSWSHLAAGELWIGSPETAIWRAAVRLVDPLPPPVNDPFDHPGQRHIMELAIESESGCWIGPPETVTGGGGPVTLHNVGDLTAWPVVEWTGAGRTITAPGIEPLTLPTTSKVARIDTNPATGTVITVDGQPDPGLWSQLRGRSFPGGIPAGGHAEWAFSVGTTATVTPRALDPWR